MPTNLPTPKDIESWIPRHLDEIVGCEDVREHFRDCLRLEGRGQNTLVTGVSGSGKTAIIKAFVSSLMCGFRNPVSQIPCGECEACRNFDVNYDEVGLFAALQTRALASGKPVNFVPVDCGRVTEAELRSLLDQRRKLGGDFIYYLDEVHRLIRRNMHDMLLISMQQRDAVWIGSTSEHEKLGRTFRRRFSAEEETSLPSTDELVRFLELRCRHWEIRLEDDSVLPLVARRSKRITSEAISVIARAAGKRDRQLTRELVLKQFD